MMTLKASIAAFKVHEMTLWFVWPGRVPPAITARLGGARAAPELQQHPLLHRLLSADTEPRNLCF